MDSVLDEEWAVVASLLPPRWRELARETGAIRRARGLSDPSKLLRLLLLHVASGLSLRSAAARAAELGLADMSDVALMKRLRTSERWLQRLAAEMFSAPSAGKADPFLAGRQWRAVDATTVEEPGATGTDWRVHFSVSLPELRCDFFEVTSDKGGETFVRFPVAEGDVLLADRGYAHRRGVAHVLNAGGDVLVRLNSSSFPLLSPNGETLDLFKWLRALKGTRAHECAVEFEYEKKKHKLRLCAVRRGKAAAAQTKEKLQRDAKRKGTKIGPQSLEAAEYVFVLTSLPNLEFDAYRILELYRARWQVELIFKRMKSLMRLGHLPKYSDPSSRAWLQGKLLTVLLIERLVSQANFVSPWGFELQAE